MNPVTVVFPIAGQAPHAGFKYKPFLEIGDETAIAAALRPFRAHVGTGVKKFVFVCLKEQEAQFGVTARLWSMFHDLPIEVVTLDKPTRGPAETLVLAVDGARISGPVIVCDSDHSVDVEPIFARLARPEPVDCLLPVWSLRGEDLRAWAVAAIASNGRVAGIAEKRLPDCAGDFLGVIGCVYFADIQRVARSMTAADSHVSNLVSHLLAAGARVDAVPLGHVEMFGDTKKLRSARAKRDVLLGTIFCDIDGVLVEHEDVPSYEQPLRVLPGSIEKLQAWSDQGYMIALMTARDARHEESLRRALATAGIPYHRLMMGLPSGPRYLINDRKPSALLTSQAQAFEVERNQGIPHLQISATAPTILRRFKGGSFAETLLVEDDEKLFVRKRVTKRENLSLGYSKLKNQFRTMERFARLSEGLVPALYGEHDNTIEYSYDMEYLPEHRLLSESTPAEQEAGLARLLATMGERVYGGGAGPGGAGEDWLVGHLGRKVYARLDGTRAHAPLDALVSSSEVVIDGVTRPGLGALLARVSTPEWLKKLAPQRVCTVHGDLTFENVLYRGDGDVRLIDMDGADYLDAPELDMGKLFQSIVARYEAWAHSDHKLFESVRGREVETARKDAPHASLERAMLDGWSPILGVGRDEVRAKGLFYMGLHLIRMVPFRLKVSEEQALYALTRAIEAISAAVA